jgi:sensor histidine kinase YesM
MAPQEGIWPGLDDLHPGMFINLIWAVVAFYFSYFYLTRFFEKKQLVKYLLLSMGYSVVIAFSFYIIFIAIIYHNFHINFVAIIPPLIGTFIIAQCGCLIRGFENWFNNIQKKSELENKNLKNELELLKSQINPHFLFNTLNNIDTLIKKSPDDASASLITLSEMLRYMIYETNTAEVPLSKEIEHLNSYIRLQQLRYKQKDYISFTFPECESTDDCNHMVPPLLFIPFVENAFKHSSANGKCPVIVIDIKVDNGQLRFTCFNYYNSGNTHGETAINNNGGVGLENVRRRLELIYPGKHILQITKNTDTFIVDLSIKI